MYHTTSIQKVTQCYKEMLQEVGWYAISPVYFTLVRPDPMQDPLKELSIIQDWSYHCFVVYPTVFGSELVALSASLIAVSALGLAAPIIFSGALMLDVIEGSKVNTPDWNQTPCDPYEQPQQVTIDLASPETVTYVPQL